MFLKSEWWWGKKNAVMLAYFRNVNLFSTTFKSQFKHSICNLLSDWIKREPRNTRTYLHQDVMSNSVPGSDSHSVVSSLVFCSSPEGPNPSVSLRYQSQLPARWGCRGRAKSHWGGLLQRAASVRAHLPAPPGWALPQQPIRDPVQSGTDAGICEWSLRHGHRQHLWAGRPAPLQHHRVGQKHPILSRTASLRASESRHTVPGYFFFPVFSLKKKKNRLPF